MKIAPSRAATQPPTRRARSGADSAVPTSTGATAAGSVRSRAAMIQMRTLDTRWSWNRPSGTPGELREVGRALGLVGLAPLARLVGGVEEQVGVVGELLDAGIAVLVGVEAGLDQAQGEGGEGEHLPAPGDGLPLQVRQRHDRVDQAHLQRLLGAVLAAEQPELL